MANKLGITEGKWTAKGGHVNTDRKHVCECSQTFTISFKESEANAKLIADAGNTAQKCGLLPSELLDQRDELLKIIIETYAICDKLTFPDELELEKLYEKCKIAIKKAIE